MENSMNAVEQNNAKSFFKDASFHAGFGEIGFAAVEPLDSEYADYLKWIDNDLHAGMEYLARRQGKRRDITILLENAKTVIVLLHNYNTDYKHSGKLEYGKISRYAWGDDYHDIIKNKLIEITKKAKDYYPDNHFKAYVDTGPILEKQWAVRAGLGWQGKNSLLLNRKFGSYFFIGIIITDLGIKADKPQRDYCSSCTACIDSCPTDAIVQPYVVDSRKCISYWTIETKGVLQFPVSLSRNLNGWLFGCDICQEVCPWNSKPHYIDFDYFRPRQNEFELPLKHILTMSQNKFQLRFKNSPLKRSKLTGLQHNARELLQNQ
jgi:epoxyqueuosine reductase